MTELKPCPFCGCSMEIRSDFYPNGSKRIEPNGWHYDKCPLNHLLWCFDVWLMLSRYGAETIIEAEGD